MSRAAETFLFEHKSYLQPNPESKAGSSEQGKTMKPIDPSEADDRDSTKEESKAATGETKKTLSSEDNDGRNVETTDSVTQDRNGATAEEGKMDVDSNPEDKKQAAMVDLEVAVVAGGEGLEATGKQESQVPSELEQRDTPQQCKEYLPSEATDVTSNDPHPHIGRVLQRSKLVPLGIGQDLVGTVLDYRETAGRVPSRWSVEWPFGDQVLGEEWVATDFSVETPMQLQQKPTLEIVQQRYQDAVQNALESSDLLSTLVLLASLEEVLQTSLHQSQDTQSTGGNTHSRHPPLYYTTNPSSYLQPPSVESNNPTPNSNAVQLTPINIGQRLRTGCQWAWNYLVAQQPPVPPPPITTSLRRTLRQPKPVIIPTVPAPLPVQRGGRVAMWWLEELEKQDAKRGKGGGRPGKESARRNEKLDENSNKKPAIKGTVNEVGDEGNEKEDPKAWESVDSIVEDDEEVSDAQNGDDEDDEYSLKEDGGDESSEELQDVEHERGNYLSPVPSPVSACDEDVEEDAPGEDREEDVHFNNPYLQPTLAAFLEYTAPPKALSAGDVQRAMCSCLVRVKHNKRVAAYGLPTASLLSIDEVVLNRETPDYPPGTVALKCVSGETFSELQKMDPQNFGRCKFVIDVVGDYEKSRHIQREQELLLKETEFKQQKAWDKWRFKGIHEGYAHWPSWKEAVADWLEENCDSLTSEKKQDETPEEATDDVILAKSLEESEISGRRRTTRRGVSSGSSEGVFYGNQSQLTQKQLMDALVRLVKVSQFHTLMGLQSLVADDSSNPVRRARIALGKLVWKRNQLLRKEVNVDLTDSYLVKMLSVTPLVEIQRPIPENKDTLGTTATKEWDLSNEERDLVSYLKSLHRTELQLRRLVLKHLAEIPVSIVATAADERSGTMESMDRSDFEDLSTIEWFSVGHEWLGKDVFRPSELEVTTDMTPCIWYRITQYSKSTKSSDEDGDGDETEPATVDRRMRFRAVAVTSLIDNVTNGDTSTLILTQAQVSAGIKAAELEKHQNSGKPASCNPFAGSVGDLVTLIPVDDAKEPTADITGRVVGHDSLFDDDYGEVEYRILILPETSSTNPGEAFWATLDIRADNSTLMCQPVGPSTLWYSIEQFDYHNGSPAFRECQAIVSWLRRQSKALPFLEPVDPVALNIPNYFDTIKNPMDISTIGEKLENSHYSSIPPGQTIGQTPVARMLNGPFRKDIELMFANAMLFNPPDDWIHQAAALLKKNTLKKITEASKSADHQLFVSTGQHRQKRSVYVDEDSDVDIYEYESDRDDDFEMGGTRRSRKRNRGRTSTNKDDFSSRAIEHSVRLQNTLRDTVGLRGPFANLPVNSDASSFSLPPRWSSRRCLVARGDGESTTLHQAQEVADLLAMQRELEEHEVTNMRRSTRAQQGLDASVKDSKHSKDDFEYFVKDASKTLQDVRSAAPRSRVEIEVELERCHEEHYAKLHQEYSNLLTSSVSKELPNIDGSSSIGLYVNGSFPPFLGTVVPLSGISESSWEIRSPFVVPALRWVIRGLIGSGHLTAIEPLTADSSMSSGVIITNDVYYWDAQLQPFEVLNLRELQRRKRANIADEEASEEDIELSEYEKLRAERVARNAERLKALGLV